MACKKIPTTPQERADLIKELRALFESHDERTLYIYVRDVSSSGMSRHMGVNYFHTDKSKTTPRGYPRIKRAWLTHIIARILDLPFDQDKETLRVSGCGMDMCWALTNDLGRALWPNGDHENKDGGQILRHEVI